ncbi:MAG: TetR family transcriptional regulator [Syntrophales bacterium]
MKKTQILHRLPKHLKISELSAYSKTPAATIRYYIAEGLLPEPIRTSMTMAYYTEDHIRGLQNIQRFKSKGLSLMAIKESINADVPDSSTQEPSNEIIYNSIRDKIVRAAVYLFRKKGYDAISVDEIVKKAGIGKATFYQHFKTKELLFFECTENVFYDIGMEVPQIRNEKDVMQRLWKRALYFGRSRMHMIDMLNLVRGAAIKENPIYREKLDEVMRNFVLPIQKELEVAISEKRIRLKDSVLLAYLLIGAVEYTTYYYRDHKINIDTLLLKAWDVAYRGAYIASEKPNNRILKDNAPRYGASANIERVSQPPDRRERIISAAVELFSQKGYAGTSIADIASRTRMSKEIFYLYFKNKDELFIECADQIFRNMYNHVWQHIKAESDMLKRLWKRRQAFFDSYQQWIVMMDLVRSLSVSVNPVFKKKLFQLLRQMINPMIREIEQLRQEGRIRKDLDSAVAGYVFMGIAEYGASLINRKMYSRKKVTEYIDKILQHGVMG